MDAGQSIRTGCGAAAAGGRARAPGWRCGQHGWQPSPLPPTTRSLAPRELPARPTACVGRCAPEPRPSGWPPHRTRLLLELLPRLVSCRPSRTPPPAAPWLPGPASPSSSPPRHAAPWLTGAIGNALLTACRRHCYGRHQVLAGRGHPYARAHAAVEPLCRASASNETSSRGIARSPRLSSIRNSRLCASSASSFATGTRVVYGLERWLSSNEKSEIPTLMDSVNFIPCLCCCCCRCTTPRII